EVGKPLPGTGLVSQVMHFLPDNPMKEAKTATGGSFHSNGEVLILKLGEAGKDLSASFSTSFCSVLQGENPDGGSWGSCGTYLNAPTSSESASMDSLSASELSKYRVLVIPGVLSSCQANTQAFQDGQKHLQEKHGMTVEFLQTANDTSTNNGARIAAYLRQKMAGSESRKYTIVSYSKRSPDVPHPLATDPQPP